MLIILESIAAIFEINLSERQMPVTILPYL